MLCSSNELVAGPDPIGRDKAQPGKDIVVFEGASMAQSVLRAGCVDELW